MKDVEFRQTTSKILVMGRKVMECLNTMVTFAYAAECDKGTVGLVLDAGSLSTKAGFAGECFPRCVIPTAVGRFRHDGLMDGVPDLCFGHKAIESRGTSTLSWPVKDGLVDNWGDIEKLWHHIFYRELHVAPEESQVMVSLHPLTERRDKEKIAEILFESFDIHELYLAVSSALVLHASGRTSGVAWENGHSCSYASPVFEGFPLKHATICSEITGDSLTHRLQSLLAQIGYSFTTPMELDILDKIKIKLCYVAADFEKELKDSKKESVSYALPDGQHVLIGEERLLCPETLFRPLKDNGANIVDDICSSINKCDNEYKHLFYENIVIAGGTSLFKGLPERLGIELSKRVIGQEQIVARVDAMPSRRYAAWLGGSILASLKSSQGFWMTNNEYGDNGAERVHYNFF